MITSPWARVFRSTPAWERATAHHGADGRVQEVSIHARVGAGDVTAIAAAITAAGVSIHARVGAGDRRTK